MASLTITYHKNPLFSEATSAVQPRLYASLDLQAYGIDYVVERLPIFYHQLSKSTGPIRVVYSTRIAGLPIETGNLGRLEYLLNDVLKVLIRFQRLPEYFFQVGDRAWPIYHLDNQFLTRYPGGPVFNAASVPELRRWLADHFKGTGRIPNRKALHLLYFSPFDLGLYAPYCMFRVQDEKIDDIPVFPIQNIQGNRLMAPINGQVLTTPFADHQGVLALCRLVGEHLVKTGKSSNRFIVSIRKLPLVAWEYICSKLSKAPVEIMYFRRVNAKFHRTQLEVLTDGDSLYTGRLNRLGRVTVFSAGNSRNLQRQVGEDLYRYQAINSPDAVRLLPSSFPENGKNVSLLDSTLHAAFFSSR